MRPLFLLALLPALASAQVNTEALRDADDWRGVRGQLGATFGYASGNSDFLEVGADARVDVHLDRERAFVVGAVRYSEADGARFVDRSFAHARLSHRLVGPLWAEGFAQIEQNAQQLLEWRILTGGGLRLAVVERPAAGLAFGLTPMFEYENLSDAAMEEPTRLVRASSYVAGRVRVNDRTSFAATVYAQPRPLEPSDTRILGSLTAQVQATRWVALRVQANVRHDTDPPEGVERTDVLVENGLVLTVPAR